MKSPNSGLYLPRKDFLGSGRDGLVGANASHGHRVRRHALGHPTVDRSLARNVGCTAILNHSPVQDVVDLHVDCIEFEMDTK